MSSPISLPDELPRIAARFAYREEAHDGTVHIFVKSSDKETFAGVVGVTVSVPRTPPHRPLAILSGASAADGTGDALPRPFVAALNALIAHPSISSLTLYRRLLYIENNLCLLLRELSALQSASLSKSAPTGEPARAASVELPRDADCSSPLLPAHAAVADPWRGLFEVTWSQDEQQALETALAETSTVSLAPSTSTTPLMTQTFWSTVSHNHLHDSKSPEQCLARFLLCQVRYTRDSCCSANPHAALVRCVTHAHYTNTT
jgi:hypothetical protein